MADGTEITEVSITKYTTLETLRGALVTSHPSENPRFAAWHEQFGMGPQVVKLDTPYHGLELAVITKETKGLLALLGKEGILHKGTRVLIKRARKGSEALACEEIEPEPSSQ